MARAAPGGRLGALPVPALRIVDISNNLGDAKSIVTHPATTTHAKIGVAARVAVGIGESTMRLSVGLEDREDLLEDLAQALADPG